MAFENYHLVAYVCDHIFQNERSINLVVHDDGDWQLLCGQEHDDGEIPHVIGIGHLIERDPSIKELEDLEDGWEASRESIGAEWVRRPISNDE